MHDWTPAADVAEARPPLPRRVAGAVGSRVRGFVGGRNTALLIAMNDFICREHAVLPVVYRPSMYGVGRQLVAPLSGWDNALSSIAEWYAEA